MDWQDLISSWPKPNTMDVERGVWGWKHSSGEWREAGGVLLELLGSECGPVLSRAVKETDINESRKRFSQCGPVGKRNKEGAVTPKSILRVLQEV